MKNFFKHFKIIVLFLAIVLAVSGCGKKSEPVAVNDEVNDNKEIMASSTPISENKQTATSNPEIATSTSETATSTDEIDTTDWKTYRNEEYGFEVNYPMVWIFDNGKLNNFAIGDIIFKIRFFENKNNLGVEEWVKQNDFFETNQYENANSDTLIPYGVDEPVNIISKDRTNFKLYCSVGVAGMSSGTAITKLLNNKLLMFSYSTGPLDQHKRGAEQERFKHVIRNFRILK